jgi:tetratricopeptide (TPR) repeat protein
MFNKKIIVISVFLLIGALIYSNSLNASFHLDDFRNIIENPDITINQLSLDTLKNAAFTDIAAGFRPVAYLSFALNYYFSGEDTTSYHLVNLLIHILNAFLIYLVILQLFNYSNAVDDERYRISAGAFFTALLWLVAPFNSQAVIYIVQRMTLFMTLFLLLSFLYYLKGREEKRVGHFILSGIFLLLSFLSKQNALIFPLIIILYELVFVRKGDLKSISKNEKALFILLIVLLISPLVIFWSQINNTFLISRQSWGFTYYERELTQFRVLVHYLSLIILPLPGRLSVTHDIIKSTSLFSPVTTFFSIIFISALFIISILRLKKSPYLSFAILWFFITMSVEAIIPVELIYDHRVYLPSIFLIGAAVNYVTEKFYGKRKRLVIPAFLSLIVLWGSFTMIRGKVWNSELSLWSDVVEKYPEEGLASLGLGKAYVLKGEHYDKAEYHLTVAINRWINGAYYVKKNLREAYAFLGEAQFKLGKLDLAAENYRKSIYYSDDRWFQPYFRLGALLYQQGDYEKAKLNFKNAVDIVPGIAENHLNLGSAYFMQRDYDNALRSYNEAVKLNPNLPDVYNAMGTIYKILEDYDKAAYHFKKALYYDPGNKKAESNLLAVEKHLNK